MRAQVNDSWTTTIPDVFSVRNTTVESYLQPIVHEIKVSRADLLCDLRKEEKRAAYLAIASQVYYVLGKSAKGTCIGTPQEIPEVFGVMLETISGLEVARVAPRRPIGPMRFDTWMALAKATPVSNSLDSDQMLL
jgi:hypothetical protein